VVLGGGGLEREKEDFKIILSNYIPWGF